MLATRVCLLSAEHFLFFGLNHQGFARNDKAVTDIISARPNCYIDDFYSVKKSSPVSHPRE